VGLEGRGGGEGEEGRGRGMGGMRIATKGGWTPLLTTWLKSTPIM
jgi:hypothetical protein